MNEQESEKLRRRIYSVDLLRGIVMMIMLLDHTRDYVHAAAMHFDPTDLSQTTVPLFFTRWITHFCAPVFVFLSGVSIYLQRMAGKSNAELSRFLLTRGLWLILVEFTIVRFGFAFNLDYSFFGMAQVIWVIGVSMVVMAWLIYLPVRVAGFFGLAMILLHNLLDGFQVPPNIAFASQPAPDISQSLWMLLHQQGVIPIFGGSSMIFVAYPLIPWIGLMAVGWATGRVYEWVTDRRRKVLLVAGSAASLLFVSLRFANVYGDPLPWSTQATPEFTLISFLNTAKYPPSLLFLLMTLGPALIVLGYTDSIRGNAIWQRISIVFGKVPMFFYILQWFVAHLAGILLSLFAGKQMAHYFQNMGPAMSIPPDHGFPLWVVYAAWIGGLIILYPLCKWWGRQKQQKKHWVLSYL